jgi:hypothetical protein
MRSLLTASLLLSPMLYAASAAALSPKVDAPVNLQASQTSSGVTSPTLDTANFYISSDSLRGTGSGPATVVLALKVDAKGNPSHVRIVQSANPILDSRVVATVLHSYFHPARLDNHAVPVDLNLVVSVQR